ncbi:MAG: hypothetical protein K2X81_00015 [Candidatus Obscuribacterales bacterium]|nr:hypothetical protein [Candidatus Obscuribacterales bacterium]
MVKRPGASNWRPVSRYHYLSDEEILDCLETNLTVQRALRFDATTRFAVLSIPATSKYHNANSVIQIRRALWAQSIKTVIYEYDSEWHIYIFLKDALASDKIHSCLRAWSGRHELELLHDTLRLHPAGESLPLPLQPGFIWLDEHCQPLFQRNDLTLQEALEHFLSDCKNSANSVDRLLELEYQSHDELQDMSPADRAQDNPFKYTADQEIAAMLASIATSDLTKDLPESSSQCLIEQSTDDGRAKLFQDCTPSENSFEAQPSGHPSPGLLEAPLQFGTDIIQSMQAIQSESTFVDSSAPELPSNPNVSDFSGRLDFCPVMSPQEPEPLVQQAPVLPAGAVTPAMNFIRPEQTVQNAIFADDLSAPDLPSDTSESILSGQLDFCPVLSPQEPKSIVQQDLPGQESVLEQTIRGAPQSIQLTLLTIPSRPLARLTNAGRRVALTKFHTEERAPPDTG